MIKNGPLYRLGVFAIIFCRKSSKFIKSVAKNHLRVPEADLDFKCDVEATYCFLGVCVFKKSRRRSQRAVLIDKLRCFNFQICKIFVYHVNE